MRELPGVEPRVETGQVRFGDDEPGVYLDRNYISGVRLAIDVLIGGAWHPAVKVRAVEILTNFDDLLRACSERTGT